MRLLSLVSVTFLGFVPAHSPVPAQMTATASVQAPAPTAAARFWHGTLDEQLVSDGGPALRVQGVVDIAGRPTCISLPYERAGGRVGIRRGMIGIDLDGDGTIDRATEFIWADGEQDHLIIAVAGHYVSIESADYAGRTITLRDHPASEYRVIDWRVGSRLPDFSFIDFDGKPRHLSDFRGKHLLMDFWGSWCGPCLAQFPALSRARDQFGARDFEILGMDFEYSAPISTVSQLLSARRVPWPNARPDSVKDLIAARFRVFGFPTQILLDPNGIVLETRSSALEGEALVETLTKLLRLPSAGPAR